MSVALAGRPAAAATGDLQLSALLLLALAIAMSGLHSVLEDVTWWFSAFGVIFVIFTVAAVTRFFVQRRWVGTAAAAIASILVVTVFFASDTALLGVIPTATTVARFGSLISAGNESIAIQTLPAFATPGIQFIVCLAVAGLAIAMDAVAIWLRSPALVGIALLVVVAAPSFVLASITDGFTFELTAVVYLFILLGRGRRIQPAVAITVGVVAVLGALIAPAVLPPVAVGGSAGSGVGILAQNINPIIDLGADLRQSDATPALSYTTTTSTGEYLRLTTLDSFEGKQWVPATPRLKPGNTVADIGRPPGLTPAINVNTVSTRVQVASAASHWLPIPYPSVRVSGLTGAWSWEDDTLSVRSAATSTVGQRYSVTSLDVEPTIQQLEDAPSSSANPLARVPAGSVPDRRGNPRRKSSGRRRRTSTRRSPCRTGFVTARSATRPRLPRGPDTTGRASASSCRFSSQERILRATSPGHGGHGPYARYPVARRCGLPARHADARGGCEDRGLPGLVEKPSRLAGAVFRGHRMGALRADAGQGIRTELPECAGHERGCSAVRHGHRGCHSRPDQHTRRGAEASRAG